MCSRAQRTVQENKKIIIIMIDTYLAWTSSIYQSRANRAGKQENNNNNDNKYLFSVNLQYIPEPGALYKEK